MKKNYSVKKRAQKIFELIFGPEILKSGHKS